MLRLTAAALLLCLGMGAANADDVLGRTNLQKMQIGQQHDKKPGRATVSRSCLTHRTRALLEQAEAHFGVTFVLVSTCRPGAVIAGTHHPSQHRYGKAVDLLVPRGISKAAVVRWFYNNAPGVTMTYARMAHVHFDIGPYHRLACGGCKRRHIQMAHAP